MIDNKKIIKALECCGDEHGNRCSKCPYYRENNDYCQEELHRYTLDLINSYESEIKELKEKIITDDKLLNDRVQEAINSVSKANQKYVDVLEKAFNDKVAELKTAKSEAIKEFWNKVKEKGYVWYSSLAGNYVIDLIDSDNLVKEMTEENENE